jgi:hypothetical protein
VFPFRGAYFTLISPHSPEECADRLREMVRADWGVGRVLAVFSEAPLLGEVSPTYIRVRKHNPYVNALQPQLTATLEAYGSGTRLDCRIGTPLPSLLLVSVLVAFVTLICSCLVLSSLMSLARGQEVTEPAWPIFGIMGFMIAWYWYGRYLTRGEKEFLEQLLMEKMEARREKSPPSP